MCFQIPGSRNRAPFPRLDSDRAKALAAFSCTSSSRFSSILNTFLSRFWRKLLSLWWIQHTHFTSSSTPVVWTLAGALHFPCPRLSLATSTGSLPPLGLLGWGPDPVPSVLHHCLCLGWGTLEEGYLQQPSVSAQVPEPRHVCEPALISIPPRYCQEGRRKPGRLGTGREGEPESLSPGCRGDDGWVKVKKLREGPASEGLYAASCQRFIRDAKISTLRPFLPPSIHLSFFTFTLLSFLHSFPPCFHPSQDAIQVLTFPCKAHTNTLTDTHTDCVSW